MEILSSLVHYTEDNFASRVPSRSLLVRLACLGKGEHRLDDRPNPSRVNQCANLDQLLPIGFDSFLFNRFVMLRAILSFISDRKPCPLMI